MVLPLETQDETAMPEVSPVGGAVPRVITGSSPVTMAQGQVFVRVNQVLVRLWALPSQISGFKPGDKV
jgi:hypothetical protein